MDFQEFKNKIITEKLGITKKYGNIFSFIDFGNVDYWFEKDKKDEEDNILLVDKKLVISLKKLAEFTSSFSIKTRFYYGHDPKNTKSIFFIDKTRDFLIIRLLSRYRKLSIISAIVKKKPTLV